MLSPRVPRRGGSRLVSPRVCHRLVRTHLSERFEMFSGYLRLCARAYDPSSLSYSFGLFDCACGFCAKLLGSLSFCPFIACRRPNSHACVRTRQPGIGRPLGPGDTGRMSGYKPLVVQVTLSKRLLFLMLTLLIYGLSFETANRQ